MSCTRLVIVVALASLCMYAMGCIQDGGGDSPGFVNNGQPDNSPNGHEFVVVWESAAEERNQIFADWLKGTVAMEGLARRLSDALVLPEDVRVVHGECGQANAFWIPSERMIVICYEFVVHAWDAFYYAVDENQEQVADDGAISSWLFVFFHELGHCLIDLLDLPITGQEEDAVDEFSTVLLVETGNGVAALNAAIFWLLVDDGRATRTELADEHSLNLQRMFNIACLVYGSDTEEFGYVLELFPELRARAPRCPGEYEQKRNAWERLLEPHDR